MTFRARGWAAIAVTVAVTGSYWVTGPTEWWVVGVKFMVSALMGLVIGRELGLRREKLRFKNACARVYVAESATTSGWWYAWSREQGVDCSRAACVHGTTPEDAIRSWALIYG